MVVAIVEAGGEMGEEEGAEVAARLLGFGEEVGIEDGAHEILHSVFGLLLGVAALSSEGVEGEPVGFAKVLESIGPLLIGARAHLLDQGPPGLGEAGGLRIHLLGNMNKTSDKSRVCQPGLR